MRSASGSNRDSRPRPAVAWRIRVAIATLCLAVHGCDTVAGGAVELSWKLRPASSSVDEKFVDCADDSNRNLPPITKIRLHWEVTNDQPDDGPLPKQSSQAWECDDNHGVTGFELPEGTANLWVTPECAEGPASPDTYTTPAIVQRTVGRGNTVSLGAVELVVVRSYCDAQPCICGPVDAGVALDHTTP